MCPYRILMVMLLPFQAMANDGKPTGWLWYQDPAPLVEEKKQEASKPANTVSQKPKTFVEEMEDNRKQYDEAMAKAILYPTNENTTRARHLHDAIIAQAGAFQESWTTSELLDPHRAVDVTSPGALKIAKEEEEKVLKSVLQELSKTYSLIYVFKEDCPYCHDFAPVVRQFAKEHHFDVQGLTKGGGCFEGMACTQNSEAVSNVNPDNAYPLLYLADPKKNTLIALAKGYVSQSALLENSKYAIKALKDRGVLN